MTIVMPELSTPTTDEPAHNEFTFRDDGHHARPGTTVVAADDHDNLIDEDGEPWYWSPPKRDEAPSGALGTTARSATFKGREVYRHDLDDDMPASPVLTVEQIQPVTLPNTDDEQWQAATFAGSLWRYVLRAGGPRPISQRAAIFRSAYRPEYLAELALPTRDSIPEGQPVTLNFCTGMRYTDRAELTEAYRARPQTWVFEKAHHNFAWLNLAAGYLARLSGSKLEVLAAVFDSRSHDEAPHAHTDAWYSAIVQLDGAKTWAIDPGGDAQEYTTHAGDVLLLPEGLVHATATPAEPGHSRHLQFSLCRHTVYATVRPEQS